MRVKRPLLPTFLLFADAALLYGSLALTLFLRYGSSGFREALQLHLVPFSILFLVWIAAFYTAGLYLSPTLKNDLAFAKTLSAALLVNAALAVVFFYYVPVFGISPKTNLLFFLLIFVPLDAAMRFFANFLASHRSAPAEVVLFGNDKNISEAERYLRAHPQLGYLPFRVSTKKELSELLRQKKIGLVVLSADTPRAVVRSLYRAIAQGTRVVKFSLFYETVFQKIPLGDIEEAWLLENVPQTHNAYETIKSMFEVACAFILAIALLPVMILTAIAVAISSGWPVIYAQRRVGLHGRLFTLYKFRTMHKNAEQRGPKWAEMHDPRITPVGSMLRFSHLDELPQLINVIKGDISFIGPRPERPEFASALAEQIPYYEIRTLVKPGITGWAQINFRYGASVEDAYEKLQYDLFYIKNRTAVLDFLIVLRTLKTLFSQAQ